MFVRRLLLVAQRGIVLFLLQVVSDTVQLMSHIYTSCTAVRLCFTAFVLLPYRQVPSPEHTETLRATVEFFTIWINGDITVLKTCF